MSFKTFVNLNSYNSDFLIFKTKDKIGKDYPKSSVSAKAVALIGMSSTRLEPACAVIQNVVSIIAEQRSLRSCCFLQTRYGAVSQGQRKIKLYKTNSI
jgi:hypothetical protein